MRLGWPFRSGAIAATLAVALAALLWWPADDPLPETPLPRMQISGTAETARIRLIPPESAGIPLPARLEGRRAETPSGIWHQWPGFAAEARFDGTAIALRFEDGVNRLRVTLDGGAGGTVTLVRPGAAELSIAGLPPGPHGIRLETLGEAGQPARFDGFFLPPGGRALPPPAPALRRIAFIGDSDTVGYGGTVRNRDCSGEEVFATTDTTQSYPARVARALGAEAVVTARSGIGLVRNYGGADPGRTMARLYPLALPDGPALPETALAADVIVIALGSNDFGTDLLPGEPWRDAAALRPDFEAALIAFLRARHAEAPGALLLLLSFTEYGAGITGAHRAAERALAAEGVRVALVELPKLDRRGCHWHPSPDDHALIAGRVTKVIDSALGGG